MDVNLLNQFILSTDHIFTQVANRSLKKESVQFFENGHKVKVSVATILGITGAIKGQLVLAIDEEIAKKFASAIMMGEPVPEYNEIAESGVCEMANMIAGETARRLLDMGFLCDLSVPSIVRGKEIEIGFYPKTPIWVIDFSSDWGQMKLILRLEVAAK